MKSDIKYIIKRILIGTGIAIALMYIKGGLIADTYAMNINFYNSNTLCATCNSGYNCSYSGSGTCATINRISIREPSYTLQNGSTYELYSTIILGVNRNNYCTTSNLGLRSDFYIGNYAGSSWVQGNTTWNNVDDINPGTNNYCNYTWGSVQKFTPNFSSSGITYDFYFSSASYINFINVSRFELVNQGSSDKDAINNASNQIINNNNQNTQNIINNNNQNTENIINSNNQINNSITDDNVDESSNKAQEFFNDFDSGDTGNLTDIISLPLDFLDRLNDTCSSIVLPIPYFGNLTLPCIQSYLSGFLPENLLTLVRLIVNGFLMYKIIASLVDFINSLKDPNNDDLEVMDL